MNYSKKNMHNFFFITAFCQHTCIIMELYFNWKF